MSGIIEREFDRLYALYARKVTHLKTWKPARQRRKELLAQIQPLEEALRPVNDEIKARRAEVYEIDQEIAMVAKALSGKADPRKTEKSG